MLGPILLAGLLPLQPTQESGWGRAGAWQMPVGDRYALGVASPGVPAFQQNRGVERSGGRVTHQGADLANGRAADTVRAAAAGLVVYTAKNAPNGYGGYIVLAHRLAKGELLYTVYAHLQSGTIAVRPGEFVAAGEPIARVGQTGRASTPHLHFEVRRSEDPSVRWEKAAVLEPVEFLTERLPAHRRDTTWARPYLEWAEFAAIITPHDPPDAPLTRGNWWRMLARSQQLPFADELPNPEALRDSLIEWSVLPVEERALPAGARVDWKSMVRDLERAKHEPMRIPPPPVAPSEHQQECERRLGAARPLHEPAPVLAQPGHPTPATACLLIAAACGPYEPPTLKSSRHGAKSSHRPTKKRRKPSASKPRSSAHSAP